MRLAAGLAVPATVGFACNLQAHAHSCRWHRHDICFSRCSDACTGCGSRWTNGRGAQAFSGAPQGRAGGIQANLETREGRVAEVNYLPGATPDTAMVDLRLSAGSDQVLARIGPAGFLRRNQVAIQEGDSVRVTGYGVTGSHGEMLVAMEVTVRGRPVHLRTERGRCGEARGRLLELAGLSGPQILILHPSAPAGEGAIKHPHVFAAHRLADYLHLSAGGHRKSGLRVLTPAKTRQIPAGHGDIHRGTVFLLEGEPDTVAALSPENGYLAQVQVVIVPGFRLQLPVAADSIEQKETAEDHYEIEQPAHGGYLPGNL
jgi:hypothetical protein